MWLRWSDWWSRWRMYGWLDSWWWNYTGYRAENSRIPIFFRLWNDLAITRHNETIVVEFT